MSSTENLAAFTHSGKYSDLVLECEGIQFNVHKVIVCTQSPVMAAACDGEFREATTNMIHIKEFDSETVRRMLGFLYTQRYLDCNEVKETVQPDSQCTLPDGVSLSGPDAGETNNITPSPMARLLRPHIKMNAIADYYDIPKLKEFANAQVQKVFNTSWSPYGFSTILEEARSSTGDKALLSILSTTAAMHMQALLTANENITSDDFANDVIRKLVSAISSTKKKLDQRISTLEQELATQREIANAANAAQLSVVNYPRSISLLGNTTTCRNCFEEFGCYIEDHGYVMLRCVNCRCRHPRELCEPSSSTSGSRHLNHPGPGV